MTSLRVEIFLMRILFLGDVVGRTGRKAITEHLARLRTEWRLDFIIVNGENATGGNGLNRSHAQGILDAGADCITLGDHAFDQRDMMTAITQESRIIRRSEEHTSELQSRRNLVCRLLLEKKNKTKQKTKKHETRMQ